MKRTKEAYFRPHQTADDSQGMSGLKQFEGEDLSYDARRQFQKEQQKQWIEQQIQEKKQRQEQEKLEEQSYAIQTLEMNRMRGMLEDEFNKKKADIRASQRETNLQFAKQKKDQDQFEKQTKLQYEEDEVNLTKARGVKRPYP